MADAPVLTRVKLDRIGNVGAGEETLLSLWTPPNFLKNIGDNLFIHATVIIAADANAKTSKVYIGGTVVAGRTASDNNSVHDMYIRAYARSSGIWAVGLTINLASGTQIMQQQDIAIGLYSPIELKLTAQGVAANDLISRVLFYSYDPAGSNFTP